MAIADKLEEIRTIKANIKKVIQDELEADLSNVPFTDYYQYIKLVLTKTILTITSDKSLYYVNDSTTITCTLKNSNGKLISGANISDGSTSVTTDSSGVATFTYKTVVPGTFSKTYTFAGDSNYIDSTNTVNWVVNKCNSILTITKDKTAYYTGDTTTVTVRLTNNVNQYLYGGSITDGTTTVATDSKGYATFTYENANEGSVTKTYTYAGNYRHNPGTATTQWSVKLSVDLTIALERGIPSLVAPEATVSLIVSSNLINKTITLKDENGEEITTTTTGDDGSATFTLIVYKTSGSNMIVYAEYNDGSSIFNSNTLKITILPTI